VCGDGIRNGTEQCDDGNLTNLDACNATCKFEQDQRVNSLSLPFTTDTYCTKNALGGAIIGGTAQNQIAGALNTGVTNGSITIMFAALGLDDLTGTNDPALMLGALNGAPVAGAGYNGNADTDWWYTTAAASIDATRTPKTLVAAAIAAKVLNVAGPASITIAVSLGGMLATLDMFGAKMRGNIGATSTPLASAGATPGHVAAEHLDPALVSYGSMSAGELCGNVTAQSLRNVPAPTALVGCGLFNCSQCYVATNTLLDIVIGGCNVAFVGQQIKPTQPDSARTPGDVYVFTANAAHVVSSCTKNGAADTLANCLNNGAYSSAFRFTTDRVIAK
jgi:cysteine-rich repeat protein